MKLDLQSKIDENSGIIVKNDERCKEKLQELATNDIQQEFVSIKFDLESKYFTKKDENEKKEYKKD